MTTLNVRISHTGNNKLYISQLTLKMRNDMI